MPVVTASSTRADEIAGQYRLRPGQKPGVVGGRPVLGEGVLARLLSGKKGRDVPRSLGSIFTLCAHAHRRTAELAMTVAGGATQATVSTPAPIQLVLETARDHLRNMALDWVPRVPDAPTTMPDLAWLKDCPLPLVARPGTLDEARAWDQLKLLQAWLEGRILGQTIGQWQQVNDKTEAFAGWCEVQAQQLPPARYLSDGYTPANALGEPVQGLDILDVDPERQTLQLTDLAHALVKQRDFAQYPTWRGQSVESGPWTRLRDRGHQRPAVRSIWSRLGARWRELLYLASLSAVDLGATSPLSSGAIALEPGQALAWCEMARGLLLHWVQLDAQGRVQDYRVLAPTEWNFHPQGRLAQMVTALSPHDHSQARLLAAAFDPCVACTVEP